MVFPGEQEEEEDYTATTGHNTPKKKKKKMTLHNFNFTDLQWGAQRNLRSAKIESNGASAADQRLRRRSSPPKFGREEGIEEDYEGEEKRSKKEGEMEVTPPWNLRKRRAPVGDSDGKEENGVRPKFDLALTKKEVEADFIAMTGHKPPRRPKKRPKNVQRQIDLMQPASYFREVTEDTYNVPDAPENGKK